MAEPLCYDPAARKRAGEITADAYAELDALVVILHERGVFRLLYDLGGALGEVSQILARNLDTEYGRNGLSNVFLLAQALGRIPTEDLQQGLETVTSAFSEPDRQPSPDEPYPPGVLGVRRLLRDEQLWQALGPVLEGVKAFSAQRRPDNGDSSQ
jgi:uncharacterized protein YjgD (DUF1641 family)